jgi:hypothetical protein
MRTSDWIRIGYNRTIISCKEMNLASKECPAYSDHLQALADKQLNEVESYFRTGSALQWPVKSQSNKKENITECSER